MHQLRSTPVQRTEEEVKLRIPRDELRVELHAAEIDARDEREKLEHRFAKFEALGTRPQPIPSEVHELRAMGLIGGRQRAVPGRTFRW